MQNLVDLCFVQFVHLIS